MSATILLVEDNADYMAINRRVLSSKGYRIVEATTLEQGREVFLAENPDLIVLDIMLPDGNGLELCEDLRQSNEKKTPILFLSALGESEDILAGYRAGGDDYLPKGTYDFHILVEKVEGIISRTRQVPDFTNKGKDLGNPRKR